MNAEKFGLIGRTKIWKGTQENPEAELVGSYEKDLLQDGSFYNAIFAGSGTTSPTGLKAYLAESMSSGLDKAINNLFTASVSTVAENGKDGIIVTTGEENYDAFNGAVFTMVTTTMTTNTAFARKWKGVATVSGSPQQWSFAGIGFNWTGPNTHKFEVLYATQSFTTVTLGVGETLTIEWEIAIN